MSIKELDVTEEKAEQLVESGNYIYVDAPNEVIEEEVIEEPKEEE